MGNERDLSKFGVVVASVSGGLVGTTGYMFLTGFIDSVVRYQVQVSERLSTFEGMVAVGKKFSETISSGYTGPIMNGGATDISDYVDGVNTTFTTGLENVDAVINAGDAFAGGCLHILNSLAHLNFVQLTSEINRHPNSAEFLALIAVIGIGMTLYSYNRSQARKSYLE